VTRPPGAAPASHALIARGIVVAAVACLALSACSKATPAGTGSSTSTSSASTTTTSAVTTSTVAIPPALKKIYDQMLAGVSKATSVHFVAKSSATDSGNTTKLQFVGDVGAEDGTEVATWSGEGQKGTFTVIGIGSTRYLKGDADSLATFFQAVPDTSASTYAGKWISFTPSDKLYAALQSDLTIALVAASLKFQPTRSVTTADTIELIGKPFERSGTPSGEKATATTSISRGTRLPIVQSFAASYGGSSETSSITFTKWGSATLPTAPSGALSWTSVQTAIAATSTTGG
jgi:hypothetical protein